MCEVNSYTEKMSVNSQCQSVTALGIIFRGANCKQKKGWVDRATQGGDRAKRDGDRSKGGSKQLGDLGRYKPPNGVQGQCPGKF